MVSEQVRKAMTHAIYLHPERIDAFNIKQDADGRWSVWHDPEVYVYDTPEEALASLAPHVPSRTKVRVIVERE